jgi:hypothetical protein
MTRYGARIASHQSPVISRQSSVASHQSPVSVVSVSRTFVLVPTALLTEELTGLRRVAITASWTHVHRPYLNAVGTVSTRRRDRVRQVPCAPARERGPRRPAASRILSGRTGHAEADAGNADCCGGARRRSADRNAWNPRPCSTRIVGSSTYVLRDQLDRVWTSPSTISSASPPTPIIPYGSGSSDGLTQLSKRPSPRERDA